MSCFMEIILVLELRNYRGHVADRFFQLRTMSCLILLFLLQSGHQVNVLHVAPQAHTTTDELINAHLRLFIANLQQLEEATKMPWFQADLFEVCSDLRVTKMDFELIPSQSHHAPIVRFQRRRRRIAFPADTQHLPEHPYRGIVLEHLGTIVQVIVSSLVRVVHAYSCENIEDGKHHHAYVSIEDGARDRGDTAKDIRQIAPVHTASCCLEETHHYSWHGAKVLHHVRLVGLTI
mmetsp:Transcript_67004/g.129582  ORF Transcript_67004/g.129582 Transcript_67004/m.129582 type:complete len:234 (-) Transcript_67004:569-1270(-)